MSLILIADNSVSERKNLRQIVENQDHVVVEVDTGHDCLEITEYHHPECILLSTSFHDTEMNNVQIFQDLLLSKIPIILLAHPDEHQKYIDIGATAILNEAPDDKSLAQKLLEVL